MNYVFKKVFIHDYYATGCFHKHLRLHFWELFQQTLRDTFISSSRWSINEIEGTTNKKMILIYC